MRARGARVLGALLAAGAASGGCQRDRFAVDLTVELSLLADPASVELTVEYRDAGDAVLAVPTVRVVSVAELDNGGDRVLVVPPSAATVVNVTGVALDASGLTIGEGTVSVPREPAIVARTLILTPIECGDGVAAGDEACDGADLRGMDCLSLLLGFGGGTLACATDCTFDTAGCIPSPTCGDGTVDPGEACDGATPPAATCATQGFDGGTLACSTSCAFDTSGCFVCGDGVANGAEECDAGDLAAQTCAGLGYVGGTLACAGDCTFDETGCLTCGDGVRQATEVCDAPDTGAETCLTQGWAAGVLGCSPACDALVDSGCWDAPTVPVQRKPLNGSYFGVAALTGSRRPTFAWETSTATSAAGPAISYELEYSTDPAFTAGPATSSTVGPATTFTPATDLPAATTVPVGNTYYWHVRACKTPACSAWSPTWRLNVGRSGHDFNGDGFADVLVGGVTYDGPGTNSGRAQLFLGSATTTATTSVVTFLGAVASEEFGYSVAFAGDLNGDGFADVVLGGDGASGVVPGVARVYFGAMAADSTPEGVLTGAGGADRFGASVASAGDVNGDGYADLLVGAAPPSPGLGTVSLFLGGPGPTFDVTADAVLTTPGVTADGFGEPAASAGDVNGDGYSDVVAGAFLDGSLAVGAGIAYVYLGDPDMTTFATSPPAGVLGPGVVDDWFGRSVATAGDVDDDGFADVIVGAPHVPASMSEPGRAYIYYGGPGTALDATADATLTGEAAADRFGISVGTAGRANDDAYADVVIGAYQHDDGIPDTGSAYVYFGGASFDAVSDGSIYGFAGGPYGTGWSVACAGDVNADGFADVVVGAPFYDAMPLNTGVVFVLHGGAGTTFDGVAEATVYATADEWFGYSVASGAP